MNTETEEKVAQELDTVIAPFRKELLTANQFELRRPILIGWVATNPVLPEVLANYAPHTDACQSLGSASPRSVFQSM